MSNINFDFIKQLLQFIYPRFSGYTDPQSRQAEFLIHTHKLCSTTIASESYFKDTHIACLASKCRLARVSGNVRVVLPVVSLISKNEVNGLPSETRP